MWHRVTTRLPQLLPVPRQELWAAALDRDEPRPGTKVWRIFNTPTYGVDGSHRFWITRTFDGPGR